MRRPCSLLVLVGLLAPTTALAGEMTTALSLGGGWGMQTLGIARGLFPFMLLLSLVIELVFRDPAQPASFRGPLWRAAIIFVLLVPLSIPGYRNTTVFGWCVFGMAGLSDSITDSVAPKDVWKKFKAVNAKWQDELVQAKKSGDLGAGEALGAGIGGYIFGALIGLALLIGQGAMWVIQEMAKVLAILLYALGPLAVVFSMPKTSDSLSRWLRTLITILAWPVLSAVMLNIISSAGLKGLEGASPAFASIATALLMGVCAAAVPAVASSLVGSGMGAIGSGLSTLTQAGSVATGAGAAMTSRLDTGGGGPQGSGGAGGASGAGQSSGAGGGGGASEGSSASSSDQAAQRAEAGGWSYPAIEAAGLRGPPSQRN